MTIVRKYKHKCGHCGGKGWKVNHALGIGTFGLGYLVQAIGGKPSSDGHCPFCKGRGYVILKEEFEVK